MKLTRWCLHDCVYKDISLLFGILFIENSPANWPNKIHNYRAVFLSAAYVATILKVYITQYWKKVWNHAKYTQCMFCKKNKKLSPSFS